MAQTVDVPRYNTHSYTQHTNALGHLSIYACMYIVLTDFISSTVFSNMFLGDCPVLGLLDFWLQMANLVGD